jgi:regulatory protein
MEDYLLITLQKARNYCAYQPRCHSEVREKLYSFSLHKKDVEQIITQLIEEGCLNEERFAIAYARGKFKLKHWGKEKIKYALKQKRISDYCIRKALALISTSDYNKTFASVANKKMQTLKSGKNIFSKKKKMKDHLQQKGFEIKMINDYLKAL